MSSGIAVLGHPQRAEQEARVADHVEQGHRDVGGPTEVGALGDGGAHEQATVGAAPDGESVARGEALVDEPVGAGDEVVEAVLLVLAHAGPVPGLALLGAAADPGDGVDAAGGAHLGDGGGVGRAHRDGEAAVAGEDGGGVRAGHGVGGPHEEHRHRRAVGRRVADLLDDHVDRVPAAQPAPVDELARDLAIRRLGVGPGPAVRGRGLGEAGERDEGLVALVGGVDARDRARARAAPPADGRCRRGRSGRGGPPRCGCSARAGTTTCTRWPRGPRRTRGRWCTSGRARPRRAGPTPPARGRRRGW